MTRWVVAVSACVLFASVLTPAGLAQDEPRALVLQEMSWVDVKAYAETNDMVIIPLGSTEQHGPHMPLGTDFYEAFGMSKLISARTGVMVAPVLMAGYSEYHSGFAGTLSLKPETMEQVLFETAEMLMRYGIRKFMFFNYHGGNNIVQQNVIHRINHETEAVAVAIGHGGPIMPEGEYAFFDWHAGVSETSIMLYLKPELVRMERAEKPEIHASARVQQLFEAMKTSPQLSLILTNLLGVPVETGKEGASHQLSSNGIWSFEDPKLATAEYGKEQVDGAVEAAVAFIEAWRQADPK